MNTSKSKLFTHKDRAESVASRRKQGVYLLGKNKRGDEVYFVGAYNAALKAAGSYNDGTRNYRDKRLPRLK